jgi:hypothetical protein
MITTVNATNYFNQKSLDEIINLLEQGKTISIYIDCIGHSRAYDEELSYYRALKEKYGDKLDFNSEGWRNLYKLKEMEL